jgi:hypothetical protein
MPPRALLVPLLLALFGVAARPADPPRPVAPADLDKIAVEALRDVHDRGADLYNAADAAAAQKLYEGGLRVVAPFLAHRPKVQAVIADGLAEVARIKGAKEQAYRLHEVIEQVRADLKAEIKRADGEKKADPGSPPQPDKKPDGGQRAESPQSPAEPPPPPKPVVGTLAGRVVLDGRPLEGCSVTLVSLDLPHPRVFTAAATDTGAYRFADPLPAGNYAAMVTDGGAVKLPARYQSVMTSGLAVAVKGGQNTADLELQSK